MSERVQEALAYAEGIEMVLHGTFSDATEDHLVVLAHEVRRLKELVELADRIADPFESDAYCAQAGLICMRDEVDAYLVARRQP